MLKDFGLEYWIRLSAWDPNNRSKYLGDEKKWEEMQKLMEEILKELKIEYKKVDGEAAFYGPKMDLIVKDSLRKEWQLSTIQVDFNLPERFDLSFIDENNNKIRPIMLHRATFGSYERFLAMIIEHFQGAFPVWLSPVQVSLLTITEAQDEYAKKLGKQLKENGIRVELDLRNETLGSKIRTATLQKIPFLGIIGEREMKENTVSLRFRDGKDLGAIKVSDLVQKVKKEIDKKA